MRLIDADAVCKRLYDDGKAFDRENGNEHFIFGVETALEVIHDTPTVDAEPVVHAHWELETDHGWAVCYHCSNCDADWHHTGVQVGTDYCPNCGARMDEEVH